MKQAYASIALKTGAATYGLCTIKIAPREWLAADLIIDFNGGQVLTEVQLLSGKNWIELEFAPDSYEYTERPKSNRAGSFYEISLRGTLNNYDGNIQQVLDSLRYHEHVALVTDRNKQVRIAGDTYAGLVLTTTNNTQNSGRGQQQVNVELAMEREHPSPFYAL